MKTFAQGPLDAATSTMSVLSLHDVAFRWRAELPDVIDIDSLNVAAGDTVFIHGPSGCGKSTLLGLLAGVLMPQRGSVRLLGTRLGARCLARGATPSAPTTSATSSSSSTCCRTCRVLDNVLLPCRFSARRAARAGADAAQRTHAAQALLAARSVSARRCGGAAPQRCRSASSSVWPRRVR